MNHELGEFELERRLIFECTVFYVLHGYRRNCGVGKFWHDLNYALERLGPEDDGLLGWREGWLVLCLHELAVFDET